MKRPRHMIEAQAPPIRRDEEEGSPANALLPQIRRQVERICDKLDLYYPDVAQLVLEHGQVTAIVYDRDENGELYRDPTGRVVQKKMRFSVDTATFKGDERDI